MARQALAPTLGQLGAFVIVGLALSWIASHFESAGRQNSRLDELVRVATISASRIQSDPKATSLSEVASILSALERQTRYRFTLIGKDGMALVDSRFHARYVGNLSDEEDVAAALGKSGETSTTSSVDLDRGLLTASAPLNLPGSPFGALRVVAERSEVMVSADVLLLRAAGIAAGAWLVSILCMRRVSRRLTEDLADIAAAVHAFSEGRLTARAPPPNAEELATLVELLNAMAQKLDRERALMHERQTELDAVLAGMVEGVIAVDLEDRLLTANPAAERFLSFDARRSLGLPVQGVVRNPELNRLLEEASSSDGPVRGEVVLRDTEDHILEVTASLLRDEQGYRLGSLLVLHDVSQLRKLERVRRDFVSNVSHELKTPISTIRGAVETLQSGAAEVPEDRKRFLAMIERSASRLAAIVDDLLSLARLEEKGRAFVLENALILPYLQEAIADVEALTLSRQVAVRLRCPEGLSAPIHPQLFVLAVVNLLDNAVRYGPEGQTVEVDASREGEFVLIRVSDQGPGIEERHLSRIFERFYRVDPSRSRKQGGTGLGLSIVKHVAQVHGGTVSADSVLGKGSIFTLKIPAIAQLREAGLQELEKGLTES